MRCSRECSRCGEKINSDQMVMRVLPHIYHLHCFVCCSCNKPLQKGEQFTIRSGQPICQVDLEKELFLARQYGDDDMIIDDGIRSRDGRRYIY